MLIIKEKETALGTIYEKYSSNGEVIQTMCAIGFVKVYLGRPYFFITDKDGNPVKEANRYLNGTLMDDSYKKRELAFTALKLLYSFFYLFSISDYQSGLDKDKVKGLKIFLKGGKRYGNINNLELKTSRKNLTVDIYMSVYRKYYEECFGIKNSALHDKSVLRTISSGGIFGKAKKVNLQKYDSSIKHRRNESIPKFITFKEYSELIAVANCLRDKIIIKLMYEYGLRIGEVLGLTIEDFEESTEKGFYNLILRNRLTDKPWQSAKCCINVYKQSDYSSDEYQTENIGFQVVVIDNEMMNLINKLIKTTFSSRIINESEAKRSNLETKCFADKVSDYENIDGNYYFFISKNLYSPLTQSGWNQILRAMFKKVGIKVDTSIKKEGLSHRFRHGFAMNLVNQGYNEVQLARELRHSDTSTVMRYFNPDQKQKAKLLKMRMAYKRE